MLELTVFLCGALVMALEMVGGRVLAPHVGTSAIVWTSLIGVVLAFLALGAWAGGLFADRKLSRRGLGLALCGAALGCAITAFCHTAIGNGVSSHIGNLYVGAVIAAIGIFALPAFFFGMITPYVIRLRIASVDTAGETVGRLYALSTAGSILGTFLGGFILISFFSSATILWGIAVSMLMLSIANAPGRSWPRVLLLALFAALAFADASHARWLASETHAWLLESPYNSIRIFEGRDPSHGGAAVRLMATDPGYSQSGMLLDEPAEPYFNYTRYYALGPKYVPHAKSILMLGGGGYSVPKWLLSGKSGLPYAREMNLRVVELDPAMTKAARQYFALEDDPRLAIEHQDARAFLNRQKNQYDLVFVDVFNSHYSIPFQMGTAEGVRAMRRAVAPGGALLMNIISAVEGENGRLFRSIWQNLDREFAETRVYAVGRPDAPDEIQNLMVLAFADKNIQPAEDGEGLHILSMSPSPEEVEKMEKNLYSGEIKKDIPPLRDEYSPVERYALMLADR